MFASNQRGGGGIRDCVFILVRVSLSMHEPSRLRKAKQVLLPHQLRKAGGASSGPGSSPRRLRPLAAFGLVLRAC